MHGLATIASLARVTLATHALEAARCRIERTIDREVVPVHAGASTRLARDAVQRRAVVAGLAAFAIRTGRVGATRVAHALTCARVAKAVALALVTVWRIVVAERALAALLARMVVVAVTLAGANITQVTLGAVVAIACLKFSILPILGKNLKKLLEGFTYSIFTPIILFKNKILKFDLI